MTGRTSKRRRVVEKIEAEIVRLRQALAEKPGDEEIERKLERALLFHGDASVRAMIAEEKDAEERKSRVRMDARIRELSKRVYKDTDGDAVKAHQDRWWERPRLELPDPIKQPDLEPEPLAPPPREGLINGTWRATPARALEIIDSYVPTRWTARHVGYRLIEAHGVLRRVPMILRPGSFGSPWPAFKTGPSEAEPTNKPKLGATADEIARMTEAISWPWQYLGTAGDVNRWAAQTIVEEFESIADGDLIVPWSDLNVIVSGLILDRVVVR